MVLKVYTFSSCIQLLLQIARYGNCKSIIICDCVYNSITYTNINNITDTKFSYKLSSKTRNSCTRTVETVPLSENDVSRTVSKSCPIRVIHEYLFNFIKSISNNEIVKSAFELFSRISSVSEDDVEISFSPVLKEPTTLIDSITVYRVNKSTDQM